MSKATELEKVMSVLEERHKLPRCIVMTRWLSNADAIFFATEAANAKVIILRKVQQTNTQIAIILVHYRYS